MKPCTGWKLSSISYHIRAPLLIVFRLFTHNRTRRHACGYALSRVTITVFIAVVLSGCTSPKAKNFVDGGNWRAQGKLGIVADGKGRSVNFDWSNSPPNFDIRLTGIFGVGATRLIKKDQYIELVTKDGSRSAASAEELLWQTLGWHVPVSNLRYWIKGEPAPDSAIETSLQNPDGTLLSLDQQGWHIDYRSYHQNSTMPKRIVARRDGLKLTLVIKSWQLL